MVPSLDPPAYERAVVAQTPSRRGCTMSGGCRDRGLEPDELRRSLERTVVLSRSGWPSASCVACSRSSAIRALCYRSERDPGRSSNWAKSCCLQAAPIIVRRRHSNTPRRCSVRTAWIRVCDPGATKRDDRQSRGLSPRSRWARHGLYARSRTRGGAGMGREVARREAQLRWIVCFVAGEASEPGEPEPNPAGATVDGR